MTDPHAEAKAMYQEYLARAAVLERYRRYASAVAKATSNPGMTPVEPLATMGKGGGPLLCDVCSKPMILEGGAYQGVYADEAWRKNPKPGWTSWISGGMVVRIESNGTLRVFNPLGPHAFHRLSLKLKNRSTSETFGKRPTYAYQLDAFTDAVLHGKPFPTTADDAVKNMTVIDAIYRAAGLPLRQPTV